MSRSRLLLTALSTALATFAVAGTSVATRLSASEVEFRVVYPELLFRASNGTEIRCRVTLEGRFANAGVYNKAAGGVYGTIVGATTSGCPISFLTENLPWTITYRSYNGTLPRIAFVDTTIHPFRFRWSMLFGSCLYETTAGAQQPFRFVRNTTAGHIEIGVLGGLGTQVRSTDCAMQEISVLGNGNFFTRAGTALVTVTLI